MQLRPDQIRKIQTYVARGHSTSHVARLADVSRTSVNRYSKRAGGGTFARGVRVGLKANSPTKVSTVENLLETLAMAEREVKLGYLDRSFLHLIEERLRLAR